MLSLITNVICTWLLTKSYLYKWWHNSHINKRLNEVENNIIADMKKAALSQLSWKQLKMLRAADDLDSFLELWKGPLKIDIDKLKIEEKRDAKERERVAREGKIGPVLVAEQTVTRESNGHAENVVFLGHDIDHEERGLLP